MRGLLRNGDEKGVVLKRLLEVAGRTAPSFEKPSGSLLPRITTPETSYPSSPSRGRGRSRSEDGVSPNKNVAWEVSAGLAYREATSCAGQKNAN